ncbi:MAG: cyclase family protein [Planctomycetota bacterium]|nr:cyclase family protein [Planctomycetota bacterium]
MLYDISPPITPGMKVWPGDTPPAREILMDMKRGDPVTLSTLHATLHLGAHADAPSHCGSDAPSIDEIDPSLYIGLCQVISVPVDRDGCVGIDEVKGMMKVERILLATGTSPDPTTFNEDFAGLDAALIDHLADAGVRLVGVDTPGVDPFGADDLPAHRRCLARNIAILEGLRLEGVPEGLYELIALPLRLVGFDASPVRAVLRTIDE